jgi:acetyl esterase/lipase
MKTGIITAFFGAILLTCFTLPILAQPIPPTEFYGELPAIEDAAISPTGNHTALLMTLQGQRQILVMDHTGTPLKQLLIGDAKVRGIHWIGDHAILVMRTETEKTGPRYGNEKLEWWRGNVIPLDDAREIVSIFADQNYIANAIIGFHGLRNIEGRWKGYFGGYRMGRASGEKARLLDTAPALYEVDLTDGKVDLIAYPDDWPMHRHWIVGANGKVAATLELHLQTGHYKIKNANGSTIAEGEQPFGNVTINGLGSGGQSIIYSYHDLMRSDRRFFEVNSSTGESKEIWTDVSVKSVIREPYGAEALGVMTTDDNVSLSDPTQQQRFEAALNTFPHLSTVVSAWTPDLSDFVINTSGNFDSGSWYRIDGTTGQRSLLGLERPAIQGPIIGKIETIKYKAQDGLDIEAILTLPPMRDAKDLPLILLPHGGPAAHDVAQFHWMAQAFAVKGYAVLQPNFRGSTNRGYSFRAAGDNEWGRKMQSDLSDGVTALAERGIVDRSRVCIMGASYGGYAALAGVTLQNGIYRCSIAINAVSDLKQMYRFELTGREDIFRRGIDRMLGEDTDLDALSPTKLARNADAPILLIHGKDDSVVPFDQALRMRNALRDARKPFQFVELDGEDHWLSQAATRKLMLDEAIKFVAMHNPPDQ